MVEVLIVAKANVDSQDKVRGGGWEYRYTVIALDEDVAIHTVTTSNELLVLQAIYLEK